MTRPSTMGSSASAMGLFLFALLVSAVSGQFTQTAVLDNGGSHLPAGTSYSCFKDILSKSDIDNKFYESDSFTGSFLAFTDDACSDFAATHGFNDTAEFLDSNYATEYATEMINLHILPSLDTNTTFAAHNLIAANGTQPMYVKVMTNSSGELVSFIYPTLAHPPEASSDEETEESEQSEETATEETEDSSSRRMLLFDHISEVLGVVEGGDPSGSKQVYYINKVLVPVSLTNELASRESTAYAAIAATPALSMFKTIIDQDIDGITELRNKLNSANFSGTVFCPHDAAFHSLFSALDTTASEFAQTFPSILTQMVQYHILPFAFNVTELTKPGNGIKDKGRGRQGGRGRGSERSESGEEGTGDEEGTDDTGGEQTRKLLSDHEGEDVKNRFQTNRPGERFDLNVIKNGEGRVFVRGKRTAADLLTPESQIAITSETGEKVFMHIIDDVLRFSNIATDKSVQALFGAGSSVKPEGQSFDSVADALGKAGKLTNGELVLDGYTFIAPSDDAFEQLAATRGTTVADLLADDQKEFLEDLLDAHTVKFGPNDELLDGDIIATKLEGTNVRYNIDDAGNESFTLTSEEATFTSGASRRRLLSTASISSTATTDDGQIMYAQGTLTSDDSSAWKAAPSVVLLLAAVLAVLI